ncbi:hypothetical protein HDV05_003785 [Chytridiales sp. JEL 0842]|nr:hypothetical protein HDV05_003785 [Chytridiales sp. JEL 0842]
MGHCRTGEGWDLQYVADIGLKLKDGTFKEVFATDEASIIPLRPKPFNALTSWNLSNTANPPHYESAGGAADSLKSLVDLAQLSLNSIDDQPGSYKLFALDLLGIAGFDTHLNIVTSGSFTFPLNFENDTAEDYIVEAHLVGRTTNNQILFIVVEDDWYADSIRGTELFEPRLVAAMIAARKLNESAGFMWGGMFAILLRGTSMTFYRMDMDSGHLSQILDGAKDNSHKGTIWRYRFNADNDLAYAVRTPSNMKTLMTALTGLGGALKDVVAKYK